MKRNFDSSDVAVATRTALQPAALANTGTVVSRAYPSSAGPAFRSGSLTRTHRALGGESVARTVFPVPARRMGASGLLSLARPATTNRGTQPRDRAYRRALRNAELAAWHANGGQIEARATPFRQAQDELARQRRKEGLLFMVLAGVTAVALAYGLHDSLEFTRRWADFAQFVQQLLG